MPDLLRIEGLRAGYGEAVVLPKLSLGLAESQVLALLGRNGAGKSTTLKSLIGLLRPREGTISIFGRQRVGEPPFRIAAAGVGYVPEGRRVFANLTVDENLRVPAERPGAWTVERVYQAFPRLAQRKSNKGSQLSGGEQEMLSIARALLLNPKLLMLDEPSQGLAPLIVADVFRIIVEARKEGVSILLVEQNVRAAVQIADRAYVLDDGKIVYEGAAKDFGADEQRVRELAGASAEVWDMGE
jgi:branched-chain amino acid transport system ATP-binding protein